LFRARITEITPDFDFVGIDQKVVCHPKTHSRLTAAGTGVALINAIIDEQLVDGELPQGYLVELFQSGKHLAVAFFIGLNADHFRPLNIIPTHSSSPTRIV